MKITKQEYDKASKIMDQADITLDERIIPWIKISIHKLKYINDKLISFYNIYFAGDGYNTTYKFSNSYDGIECEAYTSYSGCSDEIDSFTIPYEMLFTDDFEGYLKNLEEEIQAHNIIEQEKLEVGKKDKINQDKIKKTETEKRLYEELKKQYGE